MSKDLLPTLRPARLAWNRGRIIGQKRPLLPRHAWSVRVRLEMAGNAPDLALCNLAVDSKPGAATWWASGSLTCSRLRT
jgi:hypothetical protein